jgi:hypothetical protein
MEVLQQIRSDEQLKMIPVVVLTSSQEEKDMLASYQLGVNASHRCWVLCHEQRRSVLAVLRLITSSIQYSVVGQVSQLCAPENLSYIDPCSAGRGYTPGLRRSLMVILPRSFSIAPRFTKSPITRVAQVRCTLDSRQ